MMLGSVASYVLAIFIGFCMGVSAGLGYVIWQSAQISHEKERASRELSQVLKHIMKSSKGKKNETKKPN